MDMIMMPIIIMITTTTTMTMTTAMPMAKAKERLAHSQAKKPVIRKLNRELSLNTLKATTFTCRWSANSSDSPKLSYSSKYATSSSNHCLTWYRLSSQPCSSQSCPSSSSTS
jgi:hypothetical protein